MLLLPAMLLGGCQLLPGADALEAELAAEQQKKSAITFEGLREKDPQAEIGAKSHPRMLAAFGGAYSDEKLEQLLALITGRLIAQTDEPERVYEVTILDSPTVNAFALPGGYLYVTRGLLALAGDSSEVAAVLAHEMAHVKANHGVRRSDEAKAADIAEAVATDVVTNPVAAELAKASSKQKLAAFSQRQELQADSVGIRHLARAGYDAFAAQRFLKAMDRYTAWRSAADAEGADMSSSHPSTPRRIELARRHARIIGPPGTGDRDRERFLQGIDGMIFGAKASEGFVRGNRFLHPGLGIAFAVPPDFDLDNREDSVVASGPEQQALRFDAVNRDGEARDPMTYISSGWVNGLDESTIRPITVGGLRGAQAKALAGDWQFSIAVFASGKRYYRFILAAPVAAEGVQNIAASIFSSFKELNRRERAALKPLQIRLATITEDDTLETLADQMQGVKRPKELFLALNGINEGDNLIPGSIVKLVRES